ncbi:MAG TPA: glutathione S-transferase family protein [Gammaproteobacteria bacterium]|nr:glutathione S-transferase family protein [Gammaproteobacteria bacterium]
MSGYLQDGQWHSGWYDTDRHQGRFERKASGFRHWIGAADGVFPAAPDRYHLYVSYACPWAHRTLILRALKGLESIVPVSVVQPVMGEHGWTFGEAGDPLQGVRHLHEIYTRAQPDYSGRVTVPVLWDRQSERIVNNESADILRMLNTAFDAWARPAPDFYPAPLRPAIDRINAQVYEHVNNGVYRAGFATAQAVYEQAYEALFDMLDQLEARLAGAAFLCGEQVTEADWRLFTTLVRFDAVYHGHFKCNRQRLVEFPQLWDYARALYQTPGVAATVRMDHIKQHYYASHTHINPTGIVPAGPATDWLAPTRRQVAPLN